MLGPASQSARARLVEGLKPLEGFQRYDDGRDTSGGWAWECGVCFCLGLSVGRSVYRTPSLTTPPPIVNAVCVTLILDDLAQGVVRATNAVRDRRFRASRELASDVWERRTIHILLAAGCASMMMMIMMMMMMMMMMIM